MKWDEDGIKWDKWKGMVINAWSWIKMELQEFKAMTTHEVKIIKIPSLI